MVSPVNQPPPPWCQVTGHYMLPDASGVIELLVPVDPQTVTDKGEPVAIVFRCSARCIIGGKPVTLSWIITNGILRDVMDTFPAEANRRCREVASPKIIIPGRG